MPPHPDRVRRNYPPDVPEPQGEPSVIRVPTPTLKRLCPNCGRWTSCPRVVRVPLKEENR